MTNRLSPRTAADVEDFASRAQIYPQRDPLPRWLEMEVSGRM